MTIYYIAKTGDDSDPGTLSEPWLTVGKANSTLTAGDTVRIRTGTYDERIIPANSGSSGSLITYENYQDEVVTVRGQTGQQAIAYLSEDYICIADLVLTHIDIILDTKFGWVELRGDHNEVRGCNLTRSGDPLQMYKDDYQERGILVFGTDSVIDDNYIRGHNQGIHFSKNTQRTVVTNNTITETGQSPIVFETSLSVLRGCLVENNILERSAIEDGIQFMPDYDAPDPFADISNYGTIIRGNIIRYNAENAIDFKGAAYIVVEDNLIYGTIGSNDGNLVAWNRNSPGSIVKGGANSIERIIIRKNILYDNFSGIRPYEDFRVYNNTCVGNNRDYTGPDSGYTSATKPVFYALHRTSPGTVKIINNIMIGHNIVDISLRTSRVTYINSNLYYNTGVSEAFCNFIANNNWPTYNFANWKAHLQGAGNVTGEDADSIEANPNFTVAPERPESDSANPDDEYTRSDFNLQPGSPAINAGEALTHTNGGGAGTVLTVDDALWFFDGYGITDGDEINVGGDVATITDIDYSTNQITVDQSITWSNGDPVSLLYAGTAPDIGAREYTTGPPPPPPPPAVSARRTIGTSLYKLRLKSAAGALVAEVTDFGALCYDKRVNYPGLCTFNLDGGHAAIDLLEHKSQVEVWRANPCQGLDWHCDFYGLYLRPDHFQRERHVFTATCPGQMWFLNTRIVAWYAQTANRTKFTGVPAETIMKTLVDYNACANATTGNGRERNGAITGLSIQADGAAGNSIDWYCAWKNLLTELQDLAQVAGGDFDLIKTGAQAWEFRWYIGQRGTDRRSTVIFARERGNMANPHYHHDRISEKTVAIVGGQGETDERDIVIRTGDDYSAGNDVEIFVDAKGYSVTAGYNAAGDKRLSELRAREEFSWEAVQSPACFYGQVASGGDYELGDLVTARAFDIEKEQKIVGATVTVVPAADTYETIDIEIETPVTAP